MFHFEARVFTLKTYFLKGSTYFLIDQANQTTPPQATILFTFNNIVITKKVVSSYSLTFIF